jgi:hypothetical protein
MTARQLDFMVRDVAIAAERRGGLTVPMIALAHKLSVRRVKAILRKMKRPEVQNRALAEILDALKIKPSRARSGPKRITPNAATL